LLQFNVFYVNANSKIYCIDIYALARLQEQTCVDLGGWSKEREKAELYPEWSPNNLCKSVMWS